MVQYLSAGFFSSGLPSNVEFLNTIEFWNLHPTGNVSPTTAHLNTHSSILYMIPHGTAVGGFYSVIGCFCLSPAAPHTGPWFFRCHGSDRLAGTNLERRYFKLSCILTFDQIYICTKSFYIYKLISILKERLQVWTYWSETLQKQLQACVIVKHSLIWEH